MLTGRPRRSAQNGRIEGGRLMISQMTQPMANRNQKQKQPKLHPCCQVISRRQEFRSLATHE